MALPLSESRPLLLKLDALHLPPTRPLLLKFDPLPLPATWPLLLMFDALLLPATWPLLLIFDALLLPATLPLLLKLDALPQSGRQVAPYLLQLFERRRRYRPHLDLVKQRTQRSQALMEGWRRCHQFARLLFRYTALLNRSCLTLTQIQTMRLSLVAVPLFLLLLLVA